MYQNAVRVTGVNHAMYAVNPGTVGNVASGYYLNSIYTVRAYHKMNRDLEWAYCFLSL